MLMNEWDAIERIAAALTESQKLDWAREESTAGDAETQRLVRNFRLIDAVIEANRQSQVGAPSPDLPFRRWKNLDLIERIGRGSYGEVYRAWDNILSVEVALKLFHADAADAGTQAPPSGPNRARPMSRQELLTEARNLIRVNHENVVRIYGVDLDHGRVGFWMEYVRGRPLNAILVEQGPYGEREAIVLGLTLCQALGAVHGAGVLHRDLKAENVVRAGGGRIVLMDFGAGAAIQASASEEPQVVGTPLYMAPEVLLHGRSSVSVGPV
ncbi:MAG: serine/threonine-protein kinase [Candidatus Eisenbacteria bacterium]